MSTNQLINPTFENAQTLLCFSSARRPVLYALVFGHPLSCARAPSYSRDLRRPVVAHKRQPLLLIGSAVEQRCTCNKAV